MEPEKIETVLEKMWDLHDKLSDAIHSVSRSYFLRTRPEDVSLPRKTAESGGGFVFAKVLPDAAEEFYEAVGEAKSLDAIRAALENLEDQLQFFHTVQVQQRAERDAAIARLEQSRIFLARRLSEHHGKKYKVIEEALAFVSETSQFVSTNYRSDLCRNKSVSSRGISFNIIKVITDGFGFAKKSLNVKEMGGVLGNAALVALSMLALLHLHQMGSEEKYMFDLPSKPENAFYNRNSRRSYIPEESSSSDNLAHLDVTLARG